MQQPTYIIDFDSTIVRVEGLEELARIALRGQPDRAAVMDRLQALTDHAMAGHIPVDQALRQRLELFKPNKYHLAELKDHLLHQITPSVWEHRAWLTYNASRIYVLSGGFEEFIVPVVARLGLPADHVLANAFELNADGDIVGHDTSRHTSRAGGKVLQVADLQLPRPVIVIGDGYTDYEIKARGQADEFWAFCENVNRPNVAARADRVLTSFSQVVRDDPLLQPTA
ncbi:MAG TPA: HAD-IB family phosphatase [Nevskiaceae bacterium]|nr:HAD-IB family phosphatase [Nevskiaceae bacterium]